MDEKKPEVIEETKPSIEDLMKEIEALKATAGAKDKEIEALKKANTNASADASSWKKKFRDTQDEASRKEAERAEADEALRSELNALRAEKRVSSYTAKLMASGYDAQTAATMAVNLPEGIGEDFFNSQKTFLETQKQLAKAEALNKQPTLTPGNPPKPADAEAAQLAEMMKAAGIK